MDPILALVAEWWWVAPASAGAGALGWAGLRGRRPSGRRLELDAALLDVRTAQENVTRSRALLKVSRAELLRVQAERSASRATPDAVADAKRRVQLADREARAAVAELRARRAGVQAARATLPRAGAAIEQLPLGRLMAEHDGLTARWIAYETDAALAIGFPQMSDARWPPLELFLREHQQASWLRPSTRDARMAPAEFGAYRDAVRRASHAFDAAERVARRGSGESVRGDGRSAEWTEVAHDLLDNAQRAITRSTDAWNRLTRDRKKPPPA